jgi:hypothetical protein
LRSDADSNAVLLILIKVVKRDLGNMFNVSNMFPASAMPDSDWWQPLWPEPERTVTSWGITPGMRVIDLCCSDGLFTLPTARLAVEVVAIDLGHGMLERTRARLGNTANTSILHRCATIAQRVPGERIVLGGCTTSLGKVGSRSAAFASKRHPSTCFILDLNREFLRTRDPASWRLMRRRDGTPLRGRLCVLDRATRRFSEG